MNKIPSSVWMILILIAGAAGILALVSYSNQKVTENLKLPIEITEYFDYECPHCAEFYPVLKGLSDKYGDKIKITYKNFAFLHEPSFPEDSTVFAYGAEAAALQGKGVEYHDAVFELYDKVLAGTAKYSDMDPVAIAQGLKLDMTKFNTDRASQAVKDKVAADKSDGTKAGVTGTPTVFVSGQLVSIGQVDPATGEVNYDDFKNTVARLVQTAEANASSSSSSTSSQTSTP